MCYWCRTLSLTKTGVICVVVTPQRQDHVWSSPLAMLLLQLRTAGLLSWNLSKQSQFSYRTGVMCGSPDPKTMSILTKTPFQSWYLKKERKKNEVISKVVTPQRQDQVCSSPLAMLHLQLRTAGLLNLKIEWANLISVQNWGYVWVATPKDIVWIDKAPLH